MMRDSKHDNNRLDNSVEQFKINNNVPKIQLKDDSKRNDIINDLDDDLKGDGITKIQEDMKCECQHGGGCVNKVCLCPLGYAGKKCEITLDLKVSRKFYYIFT